MTKSVEPNIADLANGWLKKHKLDYKLEQESLNSEIDKALNDYFTKNGGQGGNRPDAKILLEDSLTNKYPAIERTAIRTIAHQILGYRVKPKAEVLQELFSDLLVRSERERQPFFVFSANLH